MSQPGRADRLTEVRLEGEIKSRAVSYGAFGPDATAVAQHDALRRAETYARTPEFACAVQSLSTETARHSLDLLFDFFTKNVRAVLIVYAPGLAVSAWRSGALKIKELMGLGPSAGLASGVLRLESEHIGKSFFAA